MIATVLLTATLGATQQQNLYRSIVNQPTMRNGYEEYLKAADLALSADLRRLVDNVELQQVPGTRIDKLRAVQRQCGPVLSMIEQGNGKNVEYPNLLDFDTLLPELQVFRSIGTALVYKAEVDFADGRVNEGMQTLLSVMLFGDKVSLSGPVIHNLVGRSITRPALGLLARNMSLVSLPSATAIAKQSREMLEGPSPWTKALTTELNVLVAVMPGIIEQPDKLTGIGFEAGIVDTVRDIPDDRRKAVVDELLFAIKRHYQARLQMMERPEKEWPRTAEQIKGIATPADPIAKLVFEAVVPDFGRVELFEITRRTQFRLLRLVSAIVTYKWTNGYWPSSLEVLEDQSITIDPLTDKQFIYQRTQESFVVFSEGTEDIGRIGLDN